MSVVCSTVASKGKHIVALNQVALIRRKHSFPCVSAVYCDVVITPSAWFWRNTRLERRRDHVERILRIDCNRNFRWLDCISCSNTDDALGEDCLGECRY